MKILKTNRFLRAYKKLPQDVRDQFVSIEKILINNPFDQRLKTHKLKGPLKNHFAISVDFKIRIIFIFVDKETILLIAIGNHDDMYRE